MHQQYHLPGWSMAQAMTGSVDLLTMLVCRMNTAVNGQDASAGKLSVEANLQLNIATRPQRFRLSVIVVDVIHGPLENIFPGFRW